MAKTNIPTPAELRNLLRYDPQTGKLYWRARTPDLFTDEKRSAEHSCAIWNARYAEAEAFTAFNFGYKVGRIFDSNYASHRVIWAMHHGEWPAEQVDHINGVRSDNRIKNLRVVTCQDNMRNAKLRHDNLSGQTGVYWFKRTKKWHAQITVDGRSKHLGYFIDKHEAIDARKIAELKYNFHPNHGR